MLLELKDYLKTQAVVSLLEITQRFAITTDHARDLLMIWENKGRVEKVNSGCNSPCGKCSTVMNERYSWVDSAA